MIPIGQVNIPLWERRSSSLPKSRPFLLLRRPSGSEGYATVLWLIWKNLRIAKPPWGVGDLYEGSLLLGGCRQSSGHAASNHRCGGFMHMAMGTLTVIQSRRNAPSGQTGNLVHILCAFSCPDNFSPPHSKTYVLFMRLKLMQFLFLVSYKCIWNNYSVLSRLSQVWSGY